MEISLLKGFLYIYIKYLMRSLKVKNDLKREEKKSSLRPIKRSPCPWRWQWPSWIMIIIRISHLYCTDDNLCKYLIMNCINSLLPYGPYLSQPLYPISFSDHNYQRLPDSWEFVEYPPQLLDLVNTYGSSNIYANYIYTVNIYEVTFMLEYWKLYMWTGWMDQYHS